MKASSIRLASVLFCFGVFQANAQEIVVPAAEPVILADLTVGETLDGEGGYTVYGRLMPAADSLRIAGLPIGLAHGVRLIRDVRAGEPLSWNDVAAPESSEAVRVRREMEKLF